MVSRKYTGDYRLENITDGKGGLKTVPVYRGTWYRFAAPAAELRRTGLRCLCLISLCTLGVLVPLLLPSEMMGRWYAAMPLVLGVFPLLELWLGLRRLRTAGERFTREHRDKVRDRLSGWSMVMAVLAGLSLIGQIVVYCTGCGIDSVPVTFSAAAALCAALCLFSAREGWRTEALPPSEDACGEGQET